MKSNTAYFFVVYAIIPLMSLTSLLIINLVTNDVVLLLLAGVIVGLVTFIITSIVKKAHGRAAFRSNRDAVGRLIYLLLSALVYATSFSVGLAMFATGNVGFVSFEYPVFMMDVRYLVVIGIVYLTNILLSKWIVGA